MINYLFQKFPKWTILGLLLVFAVLFGMAIRSYFQNELIDTVVYSVLFLEKVTDFFKYLKAWIDLDIEQASE